MDAVSKLAQPDLSDNFQDTVLRLSHLSDAASFVVDRLIASGGKKKDTSVLL
jgi:hypothetical protein